MSDFAAYHSIRYQPLLRAVGAYLDGENCHSMELVEEPDGFTVLLSAERYSPAMRRVHFTFDELLSREQELRAGRSPQGDRSSGRPGGVSSYQDFLRALGFELEQARAYFVLIAELEENFLVTYQFLNPTEGFMVRKRMAVMGVDDRQEMLNKAYARRAVDPQQKRSLREIFARS